VLDLAGLARRLVVLLALAPLLDEGVEVTCHRSPFFNTRSTLEENFSLRIRCEANFSTSDKNLLKTATSQGWCAEKS
jgi:hypothetical protein